MTCFRCLREECICKRKKEPITISWKKAIPMLIGLGVGLLGGIIFLIVIK